MSSPGSDLKLAVLLAIIGEHGPIPCAHVARVRALAPPKMGAAANGRIPQDAKFRYRCEASELVAQDGRVVLALAPGALKTGESFELAERACVERDAISEALGRLPWDRTPLGRPLTPEDVGIVLRHVRASSKGVEVLPRSTGEIAAWIPPAGLRKKSESTRISFRSGTPRDEE